MEAFGSDSGVPSDVGKVFSCMRSVHPTSPLLRANRRGHRTRHNPHWPRADRHAAGLSIGRAKHLDTTCTWHSERVGYGAKKQMTR